MAILNFTKDKKRLVFLFNHSGKIDIKAAKPGHSVYICGLFLGKNKDVFEIKTLQHHKAPDTFSNLLIKGVFFDKSRFHHQGLIRIEKSAQRSHAYQKSQSLVMSGETFVESEPFLEILADDVMCKHGSTTGKLEDDQIYYLKTRGLSEKKAKHALIDGFINDLFLEIEKLGFKNEVKNYKKQCSALIK
ncbi:MAG: SufD family Fe-S cluster assembly protein [Candidatus Nealsonbacteria bacterium]|nr:SufD family Fe-S cluster assembly protein [Candidatus Nealsonbacteria bacterium]